MYIKKILVSLLISLLIGSFSYLVFLFINATRGQFTTKVLVVFGTFGLLFFIASIILVRISKEEI